MTDNQENTPTAQQVNDAQLLDDLTSLQQPSIMEQHPIGEFDVDHTPSDAFCMDEDERNGRAKKGWL